MVKDFIDPEKKEQYARWIKSEKLSFLETENSFTQRQLIAIADSAPKWLGCFGVQHGVITYINWRITNQSFGGIAYFITHHPKRWEEMMRHDYPRDKKLIEDALEKLGLYPIPWDIKDRYEAHNVYYDEDLGELSYHIFIAPDGQKFPVY